MDKQEYDAVMLQGKRVPLVQAYLFAEPDRTLLYGYTVEKHTFHVYLKDGLIHRVIYNQRDEVLDYQAHATWEAPSLVPDKRAYPERTDAGFARLMLHHRIDIHYMKFNQDRYDCFKDRKFHGIVPA
jgi:hypothetical protein